MEKKIKYILFSLILGFLFLHMFQQITDSVFVRPLKGSVKLTNKPVFTWEDWYSEKFQQKTEEYLNDHFGFRSWYVRLHNQIEYELYSKANARSVIIGKDGQLFEEMYVTSYLGHDFIGEELIKERARKLKVIQDSLANMGKHLLIILAPGKATFYPELIPDRYERRNDSTNYKSWAQFLNEYNLNVIDFNDYFLQMKDTTRYNLFPKTGVHWSTYGEYIALDSIMKYIEFKFRKDVPDIDISEIILSNEPKYRETDIEDGMNLIFELDRDIYAYPNLKVDQAGKFKPNTIVIADSFYWGYYGRYISKEIFGDNQFWFYYKQIHTKNEKKTRADINLAYEIENNDLFIIMATEHNTKEIGWGFIWDAYKLLHIDNTQNSTIEKSSVNLEGIINEIKSNPNWLKRIRDRSKNEGISFDEALMSEAKWVKQKREKQLEQEQAESNTLENSTAEESEEEKEARIKEIIQVIYDTPKWLNSIKEKSQERGIPLEKMIRLDAEWFYEQNKDK